MNRGRLRRYALRVLAAASLGVALIITAGVAHADTLNGADTTSVGKVIQQPSQFSSAQETNWT